MRNKKSKKIFITGGTGFIGTPVVRKLEERGYSILLLSRSTKYKSSSANVKIIKGDLADFAKWQNKLKDFAPDAAIHMAWEGMHEHTIANGRKNLDYGMDLMQFLGEIGCKKFILTSSCWEYGPPTQSGKAPFNIYGAVKKSLYSMGSEIIKKYDMKLIWPRIFYAYGPGQYPQSLVQYVINSAKLGKKAEIRNLDGQNDFVFVEDVAEAICEITEKVNTSETFDIGSGKLTSIGNIVGLILSGFGLENNYKKVKADNDDKFNGIKANNSQLRKIIDWKPLSISEGIKKTIEDSIQKK